MKILDHYAKLNTPYLHGGGLQATEQLISMAKISHQPATLFELGCGTGASLVHLAHNLPKLSLIGGDISSHMLAKAKQRIKLSGLSKRIELIQVAQNQVLPLSDSSVDIVWIESVLGIQSTESITSLLAEVHRILKPGGSLLQNETLWLEETPMATRKRINTNCLTHFGIIQANTDLATPSSWKKTLLTSGFVPQDMAALKPATQRSNSSDGFTANLGSYFFNLLGKFLRIVHPKRVKKKQLITQTLSEILDQNSQLMNAYLFVSSCKKPS